MCICGSVWQVYLVLFTFGYCRVSNVGTRNGISLAHFSCSVSVSDVGPLSILVSIPSMSPKLAPCEALHQVFDDDIHGFCYTQSSWAMAFIYLLLMPSVTIVTFRFPVRPNQLDKLPSFLVCFRSNFGLKQNEFSGNAPTDFGLDTVDFLWSMLGVDVCQWCWDSPTRETRFLQRTTEWATWSEPDWGY